jgi:hypothetical protein
MKKLLLLIPLLFLSCAEERRDPALTLHPGSLKNSLSPEQIAILAKDNYERKCYRKDFYFSVSAMKFLNVILLSLIWEKLHAQQMMAGPVSKRRFVTKVR